MATNIQTTPGFCPDCGSILPLLKMSGNVVCYNCKNEHQPSVFGDMNVEYTIEFNRRLNPNDKKEKADDEDLEDGPTVERRCPSCGNDKMSYATIQLRSVDEGQTVFYTCTKCSFKESENS